MTRKPRNPERFQPGTHAVQEGPGDWEWAVHDGDGKRLPGRWFLSKEDARFYADQGRRVERLNDKERRA